MYTLSYVLYGIGGVASLILLGFIIALVTKKGSSKVSKIAIILSLIIAVGSFGYGGYHQYTTNKAIEAADDEFADNAEKFTKLYAKNNVLLQKAGVNILQTWKNEGESADESGEDFDVEKVVTHAISENAETIVQAQENTKKLKKYLSNMNDYDTGEYDYDAYKKAYDDMNDLTKYISSPYGSFETFVKKYNSIVDKVSKDYDDINVE